MDQLLGSQLAGTGTIFESLLPFFRAVIPKLCNFLQSEYNYHSHFTNVIFLTIVIGRLQRGKGAGVDVFDCGKVRASSVVWGPLCVQKNQDVDSGSTIHSPGKWINFFDPQFPYCKIYSCLRIHGRLFPGFPTDTLSHSRLILPTCRFSILRFNQLRTDFLRFSWSVPRILDWLTPRMLNLWRGRVDCEWLGHDSVKLL